MDRIALALLFCAASGTAVATELTIGQTVEATVVAVTPLRTTTTVATDDCRLAAAPAPTVDAAMLADLRRTCTTTTSTSRERDGYVVVLRSATGARIEGRMPAAPAVGTQVRVPLSFASTRAGD